MALCLVTQVDVGLSYTPLLLVQAYHTQPRQELARVFRHIGVRDPTAEEWERMLTADMANHRSTELRMREDTRQLLMKFFAPFNKALFDAVPSLDPGLWQSSRRGAG